MRKGTKCKHPIALNDTSIDLYWRCERLHLPGQQCNLGRRQWARHQHLNQLRPAKLSPCSSPLFGVHIRFPLTKFNLIRFFLWYQSIKFVTRSRSRGESEARRWLWTDHDCISSWSQDFSPALNPVTDPLSCKCRGRPFQTAGAAVLKAPCSKPILTRGCSSRHWFEDLRTRWGRYGCSIDDRYSGEPVFWTLYAMTAILKLTRCLTGNQCRVRRSSTTSADHDTRPTTRARLFWTVCNLSKFLFDIP